ncbi:Pr6Pr family membrane protein [Mucilaginibacter sp. BJC16-A38]|uniref:Pr6Pr family membrane protein n=1 Tax=Mucilaginibacter phenanthrenivorans TaxID=1234842 RepID=UPI00358F6DC9|nr:Pr6Pr family membrane protein [Mucilaginibacter phenanthrenivorans]
MRFLIYWFAFVPKDGLSYKNILPWLWYPLIYFVYVLIRGAISGNYPYPFLNVAKSGYPQVMLNALILAPLMWGLGALFVLVARYLSSRDNINP